MLTNLKTYHNNTSQKTFKARIIIPFHSESRKAKSSSQVDRGGGCRGMKKEKKFYNLKATCG